MKKMINNSKRGVSLVEVLISSVIFVIAALGMFSTLSMMRVSSDVSDERLQAAYFGKQVLEDLRAKVDQRSFCMVTNDYEAGTPLTLGTHTVTDGNYTSEYTVTIDNATGARRVDMTVTW